MVNVTDDVAEKVLLRVDEDVTVPVTEEVSVVEALAVIEK